MFTWRYRVRILPYARNKYFNIFYLIYLCVIKSDILYLHFSRSVRNTLRQHYSRACRRCRRYSAWLLPKNCPKLNLDETIDQVLIEEIRRKSMGLTIDESAEAHNSTESIDRLNRSRKQAKRTGRNSSRPRHREDRQRSKSRNSRSSVFWTHCRKTGHETSDCWSIKRKENGRRFEKNTGRSESNRSPEGNQVNVTDSRFEEILSLEESTIWEIHYGAKDAHMWLLDFGATFHVTPNIEWFSNYTAETSNTVQLGNGQECKITGNREVCIQLPNDNTITLQ